MYVAESRPEPNAELRDFSSRLTNYSQVRAPSATMNTPITLRKLRWKTSGPRVTPTATRSITRGPKAAATEVVKKVRAAL
jgi:hypothetical protein